MSTMPPRSDTILCHAWLDGLRLIMRNTDWPLSSPSAPSTSCPKGIFLKILDVFLVFFGGENLTPL